MKDQMEIQSNLEMASQEDLQQKADLQMSVDQQEKQTKFTVQSVDIEFEGQGKITDKKQPNLAENDLNS